MKNTHYLKGCKMGKIIYTVLTSLDGFIEDDNGKFDWAMPSEEIHTYINNSEKKSSLFIFGRKMYEVMKTWERMPDLQSMPNYVIEFADIWKTTKKIVYSSTLKKLETSNTILKTTIYRDELVEMKKIEKGYISIGGAELASTLLSLELIDQINLFEFPVLIGSGKKWITLNRKIDLERYEYRHFENGVNFAKYKVHYK